MTRIKEAWIVGAEVLLVDTAPERRRGSDHDPAQPAKENRVERHPPDRRPCPRGASPDPEARVARVGAELRLAFPSRPVRRGRHPRPARFDDYMEREGVDVAVLFCEYSPKSTGIQPVEDLILSSPITPNASSSWPTSTHLHFPVVDELERQIELGAVGLVHPVHVLRPQRPYALPGLRLLRKGRLPRRLPLRHECLPGLDEPLRRPCPDRGRRTRLPRPHHSPRPRRRGWWYAPRIYHSCAPTSGSRSPDSPTGSPITTGTSTSNASPGR